VAERLLAGSHRSFRAAGLFLFRLERGFGIAPDQLALLATGDPEAVVRRVGTAGPRHGVSNEKLLAWLRALAKDHPLDLADVAPDYLAGRFERLPPDPRAVARRASEIAPDLLAGASNTVESLAEEIRTTGSFRLLWD